MSVIQFTFIQFGCVEYVYICVFIYTIVTMNMHGNCIEKIVLVFKWYDDRLMSIHINALSFYIYIYANMNDIHLTKTNQNNDIAQIL